MLQTATVHDDHLRAARARESTRGLTSDARDLVELFRALYDETARVMDATVFLFATYDELSQTVQVVRQMDHAMSTAAAPSHSARV